MSSAYFDKNLPALLYTLSVVFSIIPTIALIFRFQVRFRSRFLLHWDDWSMLVALIGCITVAILIIISTAAGGMGRPLKRDDNGKPIYDHAYMIFQRANYGIDLAQMLALGPAKISVLLLYRRIFGIEGRRFNIISMILIIFVTGWTITFFLTNAFQYTPVDDMWNKPPGKAHGTYKYGTRMFLAQAYAGVVLDVFILALPVPLVWKLQMKLRRKLQISAVFLLGAITTGASIARTVVQYGVAREFDSHNVDKTYFLAPIAYWPLIESALGIVAGCMPLLRPISQIYSIRNMLGHSSRALLSIFTTSSRNTEASNHGYRSADSSESNAPFPKQGTQSDKWFKPYDLSVLAQTVDNETQIRANPAADVSEDVVDGSIRYERGYEVSFENGKTHV